ncbi:MAG: outer membrane protein transport protein [Sphingobacteriales bacterium]|nr:outer membrane protein transport protein [Sphingobacteriales bacterium]
MKGVINPRVINPQTGMTFGDLFSAPAEMGGLNYSEVVASANMQSLKAFGLNGKIGVAYKPTDKLSIGIDYSNPVNLNYKNGTANMDMTYQMNNGFGKVVTMLMQAEPEMTQQEAVQQAMQMFSGMGIDLTKGAADKYDAQAKFGLPQSLAFGLSYAATKKLRVAIDGEWINWEKAFDQMDITLAGGTNPNINKMMGTEGTIAMPFPMYWKNTMVIRTGAEYDATKKLTLRAGYVYGDNPVPSNTIFPVFPAVVKHHITAGASVKVAKAWMINAAYEYAFRNNQKATTVSYIGKEYNSSTSGLANNIFHVSVSWLLK